MITEYIIPGLLFGIGGMFEGLADRLAFHNTFNGKFWNENSWLNKYKNRDPLQGQTFKGKYLTFLTDGFHLAKMFNHLFSAGAIALKMGDIGHKQWYLIMAELFAYWIVNRIGFNITYR